jgi:hypothetical protein
LGEIAGRLNATEGRLERLIQFFVHHPLPENEFEQLMQIIGESNEEKEDDSAQREAIMIALNPDMLEIEKALELFQDLFPMAHKYPTATRRAATVLTGHPRGYILIANQTRLV